MGVGAGQPRDIEVFAVGAPLRLPLAGGGTDLPEYFVGRGTRVLSAAVSLRMVTVWEPEGGRNEPAGEEQPLTSLFRVRHPGGSVRVDCPISPGAGLGGSGALAVCLVAMDRLLRGEGLDDPLAIGLEAYRWERELLGQPVGFQDHLSSALGGYVDMMATPEGTIWAKRRDDLARALDEMLVTSIMIVESGLRREASSHLRALGQTFAKWTTGRPDLADPSEVERCLLQRDGALFGRILRRHWEVKRSLVPEASSAEIEATISVLMRAGATGVKLIGAGGGGFFMAAGPPAARARLESAVLNRGLSILKVTVESKGVALDAILKP